MPITFFYGIFVIQNMTRSFKKEEKRKFITIENYGLALLDRLAKSYFQICFKKHWVFFNYWFFLCDVSLVSFTIFQHKQKPSEIINAHSFWTTVNKIG